MNFDKNGLATLSDGTLVHDCVLRVRGEASRMSLATLSADELGSLDRAIEHGRALLDDQVRGLKSFLGRTGVSPEMMYEQVIMRHGQIVATTRALGVLEELRAGGGGQR